VNPLSRPILLGWVFLVAPFGSADGQDLVVDPDGPLTSLTEAVRVALPGDLILVRPGTYREPTVVIEKTLSIVGEGFPVFDGQGERQLIVVTADSVRIEGLELRNVGVSFVEDRAGLKIEEVVGCTIRGNRLVDTFFGIYLQESASCVLADNDIRGSATKETNSGNGIHLWYSKDILVEGNTVVGHRDGVYFEFVEDSRVVGNVSEDNLRYGLHFMFSDRCAYRENAFRNNGAGVAVMYTKNVEMVDNEFSDNWGGAAFGLLLKDITDSRIEGNLFLRNTTGLYGEGLNRTEVVDNDFLENGRAVKIMANSLDSFFTGNNFIGNTFDVTTNSRTAYSQFDRNHWDEYRGYDLDRDGYGDVPFQPVRLFSLVVEANPPALVLLRSLFVRLLDVAESVLPALTPTELSDGRPLMRPLARGDG
jgi:nitrous oxidase accessory protein